MYTSYHRSCTTSMRRNCLLKPFWRRTRACIDIYMHVYIRVGVYVYMHTYIQTLAQIMFGELEQHLLAPFWRKTSVSVYVYMSADMNMHMFINIYMHACINS